MTQEQKERFIASYYENVSLFNAHNGIRLVDVDDHYGHVEVTLTPQSMNPLHTAHGGLIFSLLDVATGVAARSCGRMTVTQDASIYFLRPGKNTEKLSAKGRVIKEGSRTGLCEAEIFTDDGTLIAKGSVTVFYLDPQKTPGE